MLEDISVLEAARLKLYRHALPVSIETHQATNLTDTK